MRDRKRIRLDAASLWEYALKILAARACSVGELRQKLQNRAERTEDVDSTISRLRDYGYLDDKRFAESFATRKLENQQFGRVRVMRDLRERRVGRALAEHSVEKVYAGIDETALIEAFIRRKFRFASREPLFEDDKALASAYRKLLRAGFRSGEIIRALKKFSQNPELLDGFEPPEPEEETEQ